MSLTNILAGLQWKLQWNAKKTDNSQYGEEERVSYKIDGTPFANRIEDGKWFITMGNHKITEPCETAEEAESLVFKLNWLTLIRVMAVVVDNTISEREKLRKEVKKKIVKEEVN